MALYINGGWRLTEGGKVVQLVQDERVTNGKTRSEKKEEPALGTTLFEEKKRKKKGDVG